MKDLFGAMIQLSGYFRQTLPVIPKSTVADELNACLKSSSLWRYVKKLKLTTNMRVPLQNDPSATEFSRQLLTLGNGQIPVDASTGLISFPANFCEFTSSKKELIIKVFPPLHKIIKISIGLVNGHYQQQRIRTSIRTTSIQLDLIAALYIKTEKKKSKAYDLFFVFLMPALREY